jgi:predicted transcriptional regulator
MSTTELQNTIIRKILDIDESDVLQKMDELLDQIKGDKLMELSDIEKRFVEMGLKQVEKGLFYTNEEVFDKTGRWLEK